MTSVGSSTGRPTPFGTATETIGVSVQGVQGAHRWSGRRRGTWRCWRRRPHRVGACAVADEISAAERSASGRRTLTSPCSDHVRSIRRRYGAMAADRAAASVTGRAGQAHDRQRAVVPTGASQLAVDVFPAGGRECRRSRRAVPVNQPSPGHEAHEEHDRGDDRDRPEVADGKPPTDETAADRVKTARRISIRRGSWPRSDRGRRPKRSARRPSRGGQEQHWTLRRPPQDPSGHGRTPRT